ncbi:hypothetical protein [Elizabethkingia anophelis]|uniref:hypothetical protein n=1 Tax=Elizabethkingia anophelis TaxID=1117645 RepID=UPI00162ADCD1|nr:hypothetical protein [Elizabethkingia anophelis]MCT4322276.1 hypothetical protein [Elizabethkingia anophelis]HAY3535341.1 hypothetical protein [Elizabethkingia anophelis]HAY3547457.1 hypothetical protein [Elizabethkingia anophelis]HAY3592040.1 hypothetical protein [Elizabethkingia anophelis]
MKKIVFTLFTILLFAVCFAQSNIKIIKKQKVFSIERKKTDAICAKISTVFADYSCKEYTNKKYSKYSPDEEVNILLKKNKIRILYTSVKESGILSKKFDQLAKIVDE